MVSLTVQLPKPDRHTDLASEKNTVWVATIRIQCGLPGSKIDFQPHADGHVEHAKCRAHHQQRNCSSATANMLSSMVITNVFIPLAIGLGRIQCRLAITQCYFQRSTWSFVGSQRYQDSTESAHVTLCVFTHRLRSHSLEVLRSLCPDPNLGSFPANLDSVSFQFRLALERCHRCKGIGTLRPCLIHCTQRPALSRHTSNRQQVGGPQMPPRKTACRHPGHEQCEKKKRDVPNAHSSYEDGLSELGEMDVDTCIGFFQMLDK